MPVMPPGSEDIGYRAAGELLRMCSEEEITIAAEMENIGIDTQQYYRYRHGGTPSAPVLARMAEAGYDVMYILTGRRST